MADSCFAIFEFLVVIDIVLRLETRQFRSDSICMRTASALIMNKLSHGQMIESHRCKVKSNHVFLDRKGHTNGGHVLLSGFE